LTGDLTGEARDATPVYPTASSEHASGCRSSRSCRFRRSQFSKIGLSDSGFNGAPMDSPPLRSLNGQKTVIGSSSPVVHLESANVAGISERATRREVLCPYVDITTTRRADLPLRRERRS
jgi:hypothetical protein